MHALRHERSTHFASTSKCRCMWGAGWEEGGSVECGIIPTSVPLKGECDSNLFAAHSYIAEYRSYYVLMNVYFMI